MKIMDWATKNIDTVKNGAIVVGTVGTVALIAPTILSISMKLITTGCLLSIGFWAGRSITNKLDIYMATRNKNLVRDIQNELGV